MSFVGTMSVYQSWQTISGFQFLLVLLGQHSLKSHLRQDTCSCFCSFPFYLFHLFPCPWKGSRPHTCPVSCPRRRYISSVCAGVSRQFHCGIVSCLPLHKAQGFWVSQARQLDLRCFVFVFCKSNTLQISFVRIYIHVSSSIHIHAHMFPAMYVPRLCAHALKKNGSCTHPTTYWTNGKTIFLLLVVPLPENKGFTYTHFRFPSNLHHNKI